MAKFGEDKAGSKNKENKATDRLSNRNPGTTNKNSWKPNLKEDVVKSVKTDSKTLGKALDTSAVKGAARKSMQEAGGRAVARLASRAGAAGAALSTGWSLGRALDEKTGIGKKMVNAVMGEPKLNREGVKVIRYNENNHPNSVPKATNGYKEEAKKAVTAKKTAVAKKASPMVERGVREGKNENIDDDVRKRAMAFVGKKDDEQEFAKGGAVKKKVKR